MHVINTVCQTTTYKRRPSLSHSDIKTNWLSRDLDLDNLANASINSCPSSRTNYLTCLWQQSAECKIIRDLLVISLPPTCGKSLFFRVSLWVHMVPLTVTLLHLTDSSERTRGKIELAVSCTCNSPAPNLTTGLILCSVVRCREGKLKTNGA